MTKSRQEEALAILWLIASIMAFSNNYTLVGWLTGIQAVIGCIGSLWYGIKEAKALRAQGE
jgi:hypothetical protein